MKKGQKDIDQRKLVLYLLDEISSQGRREVEVWLNESQENREEYELFKKTWNETGKYDHFPREINLDNVWESFSRRLDEEAIPEPKIKLPNRNIRTLRILYAAAAVLLLSWISVTTIRIIRHSEGRSNLIVAELEQVVMDTLSDGSSIQLNQNSSLKIARKFNTNERKVELDGEAFFEVKPDSSRPFIVETTRGIVKVMGTSFQVKGYADTDMEVFVEEGRVEISGLDDQGEGIKLILNPGDRGIIRYPGGEIIRGVNLEPDELFWANKKLIFDETRLSLVFELLKKHYGVEIVVENDSINTCLLSAIFNNEEIDQILAVIGISFDLTVEKDQDNFIINGKGCGDE